jgi:hypothetical protein
MPRITKGGALRRIVHVGMGSARDKLMQLRQFRIGTCIEAA